MFDQNNLLYCFIVYNLMDFVCFNQIDQVFIRYSTWFHFVLTPDDDHLCNFYIINYQSCRCCFAMNKHNVWLYFSFISMDVNIVDVQKLWLYHAYDMFNSVKKLWIDINNVTSNCLLNYWFTVVLCFWARSNFYCVVDLARRCSNRKCCSYWIF